MGAGLVVATVGIISEHDISTDSGAEMVAGATMLGAAGWGYSAYKGFGWTSECRRREALSEQAIADHLRTLARNAGAPDDT